LRPQLPMLVNRLDAAGCRLERNVGSDRRDSLPARLMELPEAISFESLDFFAKILRPTPARFAVMVGLFVATSPRCNLYRYRENTGGAPQACRPRNSATPGIPFRIRKARGVRIQEKTKIGFVPVIEVKHIERDPANASERAVSNCPQFPNAAQPDQFPESARLYESATFFGNVDQGGARREQIRRFWRGWFGPKALAVSRCDRLIRDKASWRANSLIPNSLYSALVSDARNSTRSSILVSSVQCQSAAYHRRARDLSHRRPCYSDPWHPKESPWNHRGNRAL